MDYKTPTYPCFVCRVEDSLGQERGSQSHPINCGWRLQRENKIREKALEEIINLAYPAMLGKEDADYKDIVLKIREVAIPAVLSNSYRKEDE